MPTTSERANGHGGGLYLAVAVISLVIAVYLTFHLIGFIFKLLFLAAAVAIGLSAWRAWRGSP